MGLLFVLTFPKPKHWTVSDINDFGVAFLLESTSETLKTNT